MVISLGVNLFELEEFTNTMGLWQNGSPIFLDLRRLSGRFLVSQMDKKNNICRWFSHLEPRFIGGFSSQWPMSDAHAENCEAVLESKPWCARRRLILGIRYSFGNGYHDN